MALAGTGITLFVVAGATFVTGVIGDVATFTLVSRPCHGGHEVVAKESSSLLQSRGVLFTRRGIFLVEVPGSKYSPGPGDEPVADGEFNATCETNGDVRVTFPTIGYGPSIAPITVKR